MITFSSEAIHISVRRANISTLPGAIIGDGGKLASIDSPNQWRLAVDSYSQQMILNFPAEKVLDLPKSY